MKEAIQKQGVTVLGILLFLVHFLFVFQLIGKGPLLRGDSIIQDDYSLHVASALAARDHFWQSGRLWGYSPNLMAGYLEGTYLSVDNKAAELFTALAVFLPPERAFAYFLFLLFLTIPFIGYGSMRVFGLSSVSSLIGSTFTTLFFYLFVGSSPGLVKDGMYSYSCSLPLAVLTGLVFWRLPEQKDFKSILFASLLLTLGTWLHLLFIIPVVPTILSSMLFTFFEHPKESRWQRVRPIVLACSLALFFGIPWISPLYYGRPYLQLVSSPHFQPLKMSNLKLKTWILPSVFCLFGFFELRVLLKKRKLLVVLPILIPTLVCFILGFFGPSIPFVMNMEPGRFQLGIYFFLLVPAVCFLANRWELIAFCFLACAPLFQIGWDTIVGEKNTLISLHDLKQGHKLPDSVFELMRFLRDNTDRTARILVEDSPSYRVVEHKYGLTHLPSFFPHLLKREIIGGPWENVALMQIFANFADEKMFGKKLDQFSDEELKKYFECYNVGWVVTWSEGAKENLMKRSFVRSFYSETYSIFEVLLPHSFVFEDLLAEVHAGPNKIEVKNASSRLTTLKYHWVEGLHTIPPLELKKALRLNDPVGFIQVENRAKKDFTVYYNP